MATSLLAKHYKAWENDKLEGVTADLRLFVQKGLDGRLDDPMYGYLDSLAGTPKSDSFEAKVFNAWSGYPQVQMNLQRRGISESEVFQEIQRLKREILETSSNKEVKG